MVPTTLFQSFPLVSRRVNPWISYFGVLNRCPTQYFCSIFTMTVRRLFGTVSNMGDRGIPKVPIGPGNGIGSANIEWSKLFFEYVPTYGHFRSVYKNGNWSPLEFHKDPFFPTHVLANVFHYGQAAFVGLKVFHCKDGSVRAFSDRLNWERLVHSCARIRMPGVSWEMWKDAVDELVRMNSSYIPPYGSDGSLYIRPFVIGTGAHLGVAPSHEFTFVATCSPVGSYYRTAKLSGLRALVPSESDRTAPLGIGDAKAAANYAADLDSLMSAKEQGYPICLYMDPLEGKYVTEFNTSNFIAISKDYSTYFTPSASRSILNSVTNRRLAEIAHGEFGLKVEKRMIEFDREVKNWAEVGAVGTAVVVTPIKSITKGGVVHQFTEEVEFLQKLHDHMRRIQKGEVSDKFGMLREIRI
jgi:branched-chain amino acid aminotransferase